MPLEKQVVSLELAKRLKELGVRQDSLFHWYQGLGGWWYLGDTAEMMNNAVEISHMTAPQFNSASAFTVAELLSLIGKPLLVPAEGAADYLAEELIGITSLTN